MSEEQTFNEWVKQLEPSMAVPMYPKALLLDFMKKSFFAGLEQHSHDYLVKTKSKITQAHTDGYNRGFAKAEEKIADIKANCDLAIEGRDVKIMELEQQIEKMKCCGNCKYSNQESAYSIVCKVGGVDKSDYINVDDNQVCDKWEIK